MIYRVAHTGQLQLRTRPYQLLLAVWTFQPVPAWIGRPLEVWMSWTKASWRNGALEA